MNDISFQLLVAKKKSRYSYSDLERMTGIPTSTLQRCINGETKKIPLDIIIQLCRVFNLDVNELTGRSQQTDDDPIDDEAWAIRERLRRDPNYRMLFSAAEKATPDHLRAAAEMLKALEPKTFPDEDVQEFPE